MDREAAALEGDPGKTIYRGEIYWVAADPSKGSLPGFPHPHLVVQDDLFNHSRIGTVVVCALSSNIRRATEPGNVLLDQGEGGLEKRSVVIASQISSIYKSRLGERIGRLSDERVGQVLSGLRFLQTAFFRGR